MSDPEQIRAFYLPLLGEGFALSAQFAATTGRRAEQVTDSPLFPAFAAEAAPGSLKSARRLGEMTVVHLSGVPQPGPWWRDLLEYESGYFLQLATTESGVPFNRPRRGVSALTRNFNWSMPALVEGLRRDHAAPLDAALQHPCTLAFSRTRDGQVHVVELDKSAAAILRVTNGLRTAPDIASAAGMTQEEAGQVLEQLAAIGAVELPDPDALRKVAGG
jgi:hypothetical protein